MENTPGTDALGEPIVGVLSVPNALSDISTLQVNNVADAAIFSSATGFSINLNYDAAALAAPASFRAGMQQAADLLAAAITDHITVNLNIHYNGTGGGAHAGPDVGHFYSYSIVRSLLVNNAAPGDHTFDALPTGSSIQGQSNVAVWAAEEKLYGLNGIGANDTTTDDGSATFATDINPSLLVGVALHEFTHALGRIPFGSQPDIFDLFRFTSAGTRLFQNGATAPAAYFSVDGGNTRLADYGQKSDASDFLNPGPTSLGPPYSNLTPNDPFNEIYGFNTLQQLTAVDLRQLAALGFHLASQSAPDDYADSLSDSTAPFGQVAVNGSNTGTLEVAGDRDWFRVTLMGGVPYVIDLKGQPSGNGTLDDPYLRVHDSSGALVAENNDIQPGTNRDSRLTYVAPATGTFYLEAGAFNDGSAGTYKIALTASTNHAPTITSNGGGSVAAFSARENLPSATTVMASDPEVGTTLTYSIIGGADASDFQIDPATGVLYFVLPADYEHPADSDHNNTYLVQVSASDGSLSDTQALTITVTDGNDAVLGMAAPADFSHDGKDDILWRNSSGAVTLWSMNGAQKLADQAVSTLGLDWTVASSADFNGDGKPDLLLRHDSGWLALWTMNGAQKVGDQVIQQMGNDWHLEDAKDFNGDGKADILWRHDNGTVAVWTMNGAQKVADQVVSPMGNDWHLAAAEDFNGDGKTDILWRHDNGTVAVWTMNGAQKVADQVVGPMDPSWKIADTADFNGDGKTDILWRHDSGAVDIWTMNGGQKVADQFVSNMGNDWHFVDTADFNGDGKADILWRHDNGTLAVWTMNGAQKVADQVVQFMGNDWHVLGLGDFNGDNKADILWRHDGGAVAEWTMNGGQKVGDQVITQQWSHDWMLA
jgi:hypothetical protein